MSKSRYSCNNIIKNLIKEIKQSKTLKVLVMIEVVLILFCIFLIYDSFVLPRPINQIEVSFNNEDKQTLNKLKYSDEVIWHKGRLISVRVQGLFWTKEEEIDINGLFYTPFTILHEYSHYLRKKSDYYSDSSVEESGLSEEEITDLIAYSLAKYYKVDMAFSEMTYVTKNRSKKEVSNLINTYNDFLQKYVELENGVEIKETVVIDGF